MMRVALASFLFALCAMTCSAQFGPPNIITEYDPSQFDLPAIPADVDGDGDQDLIMGELPLTELFNDGTGVYEHHTTPLGPDFCQPLFVADADMDGDLDLFCKLTYSFQFALNDGTGQFTLLPPAFTTSWDAEGGFSHGDLDGDGDLDVVFGYNNNARWAANDGTGNFGPIQTIVTSGLGDWTSTDIADMDNDGDLDVVASMVAAFVCRNNGAGIFAAEIFTDVEGRLKALDVDHDGVMDILAEDVTFTGGPILWAQGMGDTAYAAVDTIAAEVWSHSPPVLSDVDGDGWRDILYAWQAKVYCLYATNSGFLPTAEVAPILAAFTSYRDPALVDRDGDGDYDIFCRISNSQTPHTGFLDQLAPGVFSTLPVWVYTPVQARRIVSSDFDADGTIDLLICDGGGGAKTIDLYRNDGTYNFAPREVAQDTVRSVYHLELGDLDMDGDQDMVHTEIYNVYVTRLCWAANDGTGQFGPKQYLDFGPGALWEVAVVDMDGDGDPDLLCSVDDALQPQWDRVLWLENDGTGSFAPFQSVFDYILQANEVFGGDLDGDGDVDVVCRNAATPRGLTLMENTGGEIFSPDTTVLTGAGNQVSSTEMGDVDGDGDLDFVFCVGQGMGAYDLSALLNDGSASFSSVLIEECLGVNGDLELADVTGDGLPEILLVSIDPELRMYPNTGLGTFGPSVLVNNDGVGCMGTADLDQDGDLDLYTGGLDKRVAWHGNPGLSTTVQALGSSEEDRISCYPNPFNEQTRLVFKEVLRSGISVEIADAQGHVVRTMVGNGTREMIIERDGLAPGVYLVRMQDGGAPGTAARMVVR